MCEESYNQISEFIQGTKKMQLAMCIQCLDILNIKGLEAEAQSRKKKTKKNPEECP